MASALPPASVATAFPWPGNLVGGVMAAALIACAFHVRRRAMHDSCAMLDLGLVLLIVNAAAIAMLNEWVPTFPDTRYLSWNALLILMYAMAAPTTPGRMFAA